MCRHCINKSIYIKEYTDCERRRYRKRRRYCRSSSDDCCDFGFGFQQYLPQCVQLCYRPIYYTYGLYGGYW